MKNSLGPTGLSLSQAQSVSNSCYQRAVEINNKLSQLNNASKFAKIDGVDYTLITAKAVPVDIDALLMEVSNLHATQAFLVENIKAKANALSELQNKRFVYQGSSKTPEMKTVERPKMLDAVNESWGWDQLSIDECSEFLENEQYAAHIGQFIHKDGPLSKLRAELPKIPQVEFSDILKKGENMPVTIKIHHTSEGLLKIYEDFSTKHRQFEAKVNYYKAKVKNLVTAENTLRSKENESLLQKYKSEMETLQTEYAHALKNHQSAVAVASQEFETKRQNDIAAIAPLRIMVHPRFKKTIDSFLIVIKEEE